MTDRSNVRWFSEAEHPFGPPQDVTIEAWKACKVNGAEHEGDCACEKVPVQLPRDERMWCSIEWAAEHGIPIPEDWRELA